MSEAKGASGWSKAAVAVRNIFSSGINRDMVDFAVEKEPFELTHGDTLAYALACDDSNPRYFEKSGGLAPPLFVSRVFMVVAEGILLHPRLKLNVLKMVHAEQSIEFIKPLTVGMKIVPKARIAAVREASSGEMVDVEIECLHQGEVAVKGVATMFVRGKKRKGSGSKDAGAVDEPAFEAVDTFTVTRDQPAKYAAASGDYNPIHRKMLAAKLAGFKAPIAHGLCVLAMTAAHLVKLYGDDDPTRLKRLAVRFSKPVFPGEELTLKAALVEGVYKFVLENPKGKPVLKNGEAVFGLP